MLEIISRVSSGFIVMAWLISIIIFKKWDKLEGLSIWSSFCLLAIGFIDCLCKAVLG